MSENPRSWRYEGWTPPWRAGLAGLLLGFATLGVILASAALFYRIKTAHFHVEAPAQFPQPGLNTADDLSPNWSLAQRPDPKTQARVGRAIHELAAEGSAAYDPPDPQP